jgi:hypothetical protein
MLKKFLIGTVVALALLVGVTASAAYDFGPTTLKVGSSGQYVMNVQTVVGATADGAFGNMTKAKVMAWQASHGLVADGVVGPATKAAMNATAPTAGTYPAGCTSAVGYSTTTGQSCAATTTYPAGCTSAMGYSSTTGAKCDGATTGGSTGVLGSDEGDIIAVKEVASADSKLEEGKDNELFAFTAEVEGDVKIDRVDFYLDSTAAAGQSENADDYFKSASLYVNGTKVGTVDVGDFVEDSYYTNATTPSDITVTGVDGDNEQYRIRFSGMSASYSDGAKPKFVLAFEALASIDGTDIGETWGVGIDTDSIRFVDGQGFSGTAGEQLNDTFTGDTQDVAKLAIKSSSNDPELTTFEVSDTDETKDVTVFKFYVEEMNDVDVTVEDMTLTLTTGTTADESAVISSADLYKGSTLLGSESVPTGGEVNFTDMGLDIDAGAKVELTLKLTFADITGYAEGETVTAVVTSIDAANDANGNDEGDMDITGETLSSEAHILRSTGISVDVKTATTTINAQDGDTDDIAEFVWTFDVTAFGDNDVYINADVADLVLDAGKAAADADIIYIVDYSTGAVLTSQGGTITESDSDVTLVTADASAYGGGYNGETFYKIDAGTTGTFTLTINGTNQTNSKQVRAELVNVEWTTDDVTAATAEDASSATINTYTSNLGVDAATPYKSIN